jgi:hypothetical protein
LDDEVTDVPKGGTNKDKPEGNKKAKEASWGIKFDGQKMMTR